MKFNWLSKVRNNLYWIFYIVLEYVVFWNFWYVIVMFVRLWSDRFDVYSIKLFKFKLVIFVLYEWVVEFVDLWLFIYLWCVFCFEFLVLYVDWIILIFWWVFVLFVNIYECCFCLILFFLFFLKILIWYFFVFF